MGRSVGLWCLTPPVRPRLPRQHQPNDHPGRREEKNTSPDDASCECGMGEVVVGRARVEEEECPGCGEDEGEGGADREHDLQHEPPTRATDVVISTCGDLQAQEPQCKLRESGKLLEWVRMYGASDAGEHEGECCDREDVPPVLASRRTPVDRPHRERSAERLGEGDLWSAWVREGNFVTGVRRYRCHPLQGNPGLQIGLETGGMPPGFRGEP